MPAPPPSQASAPHSLPSAGPRPLALSGHSPGCRPLPIPDSTGGVPSIRPRSNEPTCPRFSELKLCDITLSPSKGCESKRSMTFASSAVSPIGQYSSVAMTVDPRRRRRRSGQGAPRGLGRSRLAHRVGHRNVAIETAGFGPGEVALAEIAIAGLVTARFGNQGVEPQQRQLVVQEHGLGRHGR